MAQETVEAVGSVIATTTSVLFKEDAGRGDDDEVVFSEGDRAQAGAAQSGFLSFAQSGALKDDTKQKNRACDNFQWLKLCAVGCHGDYFQSSVDSIRALFPGHLHQHKDPIETMKQGHLVLAWDMNRQTFVSKLLKMDDQLRFLYIMAVDSKPSSARGTPLSAREVPVSMDIHHIKNIYLLDDAIRICDRYNVVHPSLNHDNALVIYTDISKKSKLPNLDEEMQPPLPSLHFLISMPQQKLINHIQACRDFAEGTCQTKTPLRVDTITLDDGGVDKLLDRKAETFEFEMTFRSTKSARVVPVLIWSCTQANMGGVKEKLQNELLPIDMARVTFVLREAIVLRTTIVDIGQEDIFQKGIAKFVNDASTVAAPLRRNSNLADNLEATDMLRRRIQETKDEDAAHHYEDAAARSTIAALHDLLMIEHEYYALSNSRGTEKGTADEDALEAVEEEESLDVDAGDSTALTTADGTAPSAAESPLKVAAEAQSMHGPSSDFDMRGLEAPGESKDESARDHNSLQKGEPRLSEVETAPGDTPARELSMASGFSTAGFSPYPELEERTASALPTISPSPEVERLQRGVPAWATQEDQSRLYQPPSEKRSADGIFACAGVASTCGNRTCGTRKDAGPNKDKDGNDCSLQ